MESRPVVVVTGRHRPHELFILGYSAVAGLSLLLTAPAPQSVLAVMGRWMVYAWGGLLLLSGLFGLWAAVGNRRAIERSLGYEQGAMLVNAAALLAFAGAILVYAPKPGWFAAGICAAWAGADIWRAVQIKQDLRQIRTARSSQ